MTRFSNHFQLDKTQAELDFVNIDVSADIPLFLDPHVFSSMQGVWARRCEELIADFFQSVIDAIRAGEDRTALVYLSGLTEPNETHLGLSRGQHASGRGVGSIQANDLLRALRGSEAVRTGFVQDLASCELLIDGIGSDKVSDITTNIVRKQLIDYTHAQCELHGIALTGTYPSGRWWDPEEKRWRQEYVPLPTAGSDRLILVPKACVRWRTAHDVNQYYSHFVVNFIRQEEIRSNGPLVQLRKNGAPYVTKKSIEQEHPLTKDFLYRFSQEHPEVLENFKQSIGRPSTISTAELAQYVDQNFSEREFAHQLSEALDAIPPGGENAGRYHKLMIGILEFIFFPRLREPKKEREINEGRKRIDITFVNAFDGGFFYREGQNPRVACTELIVECKGRVPARGVSTQPGQAEIHDTQRATAGSRVGAVSQSDCKPSSCM